MQHSYIEEYLQKEDGLDEDFGRKNIRRRIYAMSESHGPV